MKSLQRQSLNQQLMDVLIANILSGDLPAGQKIPPEAELADQLRVSRNTLREALKTLELFGIIESFHGQGTFISVQAKQRIPNIDILKLLSRDHDVQSLLDARLVIEPGLAALAAQRRSEEELDTIGRCIGVFLDEEQGLENMFHIQLAKAAKSPVLFGYLQGVFQQLIHTAYPQLQKKLLPDYRETEIREHREILEAITEQDALAARDLMHRHLKRRFRLLTEE